jgi:glycosyltransferase involved in cell wall biosynthesis
VTTRCVKSGLKILFAGFFSYRKGADTIIEALQAMHDTGWTIEIAGMVEKTILEKYPSFFKMDNVVQLGMLSRKDLAFAMRNNEVFLFPSRAEGSARVIFEALAAGCYLITTVNSGSIVEDNVHGKIIPIGNAQAILEAVHEAYVNRERTWAIGAKNSEVVLQNYTQKVYGDSLAVLYKKLLQEKEEFKL